MKKLDNRKKIQTSTSTSIQKAIAKKSNGSGGATTGVKKTGLFGVSYRNKQLSTEHTFLCILGAKDDKRNTSGTAGSKKVNHIISTF